MLYLDLNIFFIECKILNFQCLKATKIKQHLINFKILKCKKKKKTTQTQTNHFIISEQV